MRLEDLQAINQPKHEVDGVLVNFRPATPADILALLREMGAVERETYRGNIYVRDIPPGRYLLVPLDVLAGRTPMSQDVNQCQHDRQTLDSDTFDVAPLSEWCPRCGVIFPLDVLTADTGKE